MMFMKKFDAKNVGLRQDESNEFVILSFIY